LAGYCNGDIRLFDLRAGTERWSTNLGSGVIGVDFDRPDIDMNKFVAVCMDSKLHAADARTQHSTKVWWAFLVLRRLKLRVASADYLPLLWLRTVTFFSESQGPRCECISTSGMSKSG
jgi:hypothetical protein